MLFLLFIVAIFPIFLIGLYIYKKDNEKEPLMLLLKLFIFGILSCFPAMIFGMLIGDFFPDDDNMSFIQLFFYIFISVAFIEEICKWVVVYKISYDHDEFDTIYDMIVYSSFVALGFACFENILYVYSLGIVTGLARAVSAVPGHVCNGILMGFYLGFAKFCSVKGDILSSKINKLLSVLIPSFTHCIYDFCIFWGSNLFVIIFLFFIIFLYSNCFRKLKMVSQNNIKFKYKGNFCSNCGSFVSGYFCPNCGRKKD